MKSLLTLTLRSTLPLGVLLLVGCVEPAPPPPEDAGAAAPVPEAGAVVDVPSFSVRGVFIAPAYDGEAATVDHEAIPGFMNAMRMTLRVGEGEDIGGLEEGDKIVFELIDTDGTGYRMTDIELLPEDTILKLGQDSAATAVPEEDALPN